MNERSKLLFFLFIASFLLALGYYRAYGLEPDQEVEIREVIEILKESRQELESLKNETDSLKLSLMESEHQISELESRLTLSDQDLERLQEDLTKQSTAWNASLTRNRIIFAGGGIIVGLVLGLIVAR